MTRQIKTAASDLLTSGWLPPKAAADALGISERQLMSRFRKGEIRRKQLAPGIFLYDTTDSR